MYSVINHIRVVPEHRADFEARFRASLAHMDGVPGFVRVDVWRPAAKEDPEAAYPTDAYQIQTVWESPEAFRAWVGSPSFEAAHRDPMPQTWRAGPAMMSQHILAFGVEGG
jgi:heme oxygenase (mycobilin-producing)